MKANKQKKDFVSSMVEILMGNAEKRKLKELSKKINKFSNKYYKTNSNELTPDFATLIYKINKSIADVTMILNSIETEIVKRRLIEYHLNERQMLILEKMDENTIEEEAEVSDIKEISMKLKSLLKEFITEFSQTKIKEIESQYKSIMNLIKLSKFDFITILRKFYPKIPYSAKLSELNLENMKFSSIKAKILSENLKDFQESIAFVDDQKNWDEIFKIVFSMKGFNSWDSKEWIKISKHLKQMKTNNYLTNVIMHAEGDLSYIPALHSEEDFKIIEEYTLALKNRVSKILNSLVSKKKSKVSGEIIKNIFGNNYRLLSINHLDENILKDIEEKVPGNKLKHIYSLSCIKTYIEEIFKTEVKEFQEMILVRATWVNKKENKEMHEVYYEILEVGEKINNLEVDLAPNKNHGQKIKKLITSKKGSFTNKQNEEFVLGLSEEIFGIIKTFLNKIIYLVKKTKTILEDYDRKKDHEVINNWKEIDNYSEKRTKKIMSLNYKKMYYMAKLIQNNLK